MVKGKVRDLLLTELHSWKDEEGRSNKRKRKVRKAAFRDPNSDVKCIGEGNKALKVAVTGEERNKR